jgi:hypothetical protein
VYRYYNKPSSALSNIAPLFAELLWSSR